MNDVLNALYVIVLTLNLFALGNGRISTVIRIVAFQGVILGVLPLLLESQITYMACITSGAAMVLKGIVIPAFMMKALREARIKREVEPLLGLLPSIIIGALVTALVLYVYAHGEKRGGDDLSLLVPTSLATVSAGFILLTTRFKAISQVLGYLVLDNGIYIFSLLLIDAIPIAVEMGMLLDLFVSIFVVSIITNHINNAFSSMDTRNLASLREE